MLINLMVIWFKTTNQITSTLQQKKLIESDLHISTLYKDRHVDNNN